MNERMVQLKNLWNRFRIYFREKGFWVPLFQSGIGFLNSRTSVVNRLNHRLRRKGNAPLGLTELYQVILTAIAVFWLLKIDRPIHPTFQSFGFRVVGSVAAVYVIYELFVFSLDWIFVAEERLESYKRSLATFILSIFQVALFFVVLFILCDCYNRPLDVWGSVYTNIGNVLQVRLAQIESKGICPVLSEFQRVVGATLMLIIVASLVGAVIRKDKKTNEEEVK